MDKRYNSFVKCKVIPSQMKNLMSYTVSVVGIVKIKPTHKYIP